MSIRDKFKVSKIMIKGINGWERMVIVGGKEGKTKFIKFNILGNKKIVSSDII